MSHLHPKFLSSATFVGILVLMAGLTVYALVRINSLQEKVQTLTTQVTSLNQNLSSTTALLTSKITDTSSTLANTISQQQSMVQQQLSNFHNQVGNLSGTLTTLQKLANTDPEVLKKYSRVYFLNENYVPANLTEIPPAYRYSDAHALLIRTEVFPHMIQLLDAASSTGLVLYADSAYRSFAEQKALKGEYTMTYGAGSANSFSADQGYSEHQLGTAIDFITNGLGGQLDGFDGTAAYQWMLANAYKFGFILSYPKNNGYYVFEPWHWRFVGVQLATDLHNQNKNFYDLDQKTIDGYLVNVFE